MKPCSADCYYSTDITTLIWPSCCSLPYSKYPSLQFARTRLVHFALGKRCRGVPPFAARGDLHAAAAFCSNCTHILADPIEATQATLSQCGVPSLYPALQSRIMIISFLARRFSFFRSLFRLGQMHNNFFIGVRMDRYGGDEKACKPRPFLDKIHTQILEQGLNLSRS